MLKLPPIAVSCPRNCKRRPSNPARISTTQSPSAPSTAPRRARSPRLLRAGHVLLGLSATRPGTARTNQCVYKPACVVRRRQRHAHGLSDLLAHPQPDWAQLQRRHQEVRGPDGGRRVHQGRLCATKPVFDRLSLADVCSAGECTCYQATHECYRKCARDIECAVGSTCDTTATCAVDGSLQR